jgi:alpha-ketoglutarate-dependent taurine dioxygenase
MLTSVLHDSRAWSTDTLDPQRAWYCTLPGQCLDALDEAVAWWRRQPRPITTVRLGESPAAGCAGMLRPVLATLESGRGFTILRGLPSERYTGEEMQLGYWLVGQLLGEPFAQNAQGTLLYDVRDTGQDVRYGARFSVTNAESSFHTDNSFGADILDYVGLLCLQPARAGGLSQVVSGFAVHNRLLSRQRDVLDALYQPFHVDRRGGLRPGEAPTGHFPVLNWNGAELLIRYLRYWIEAGHDKVGEPLTTEQVRALNVLDEVLAEPSLRAEFTLERGDMFFINNRWILHNRTAFEDYPEPERRRHYVRLWLRTTSGL